jgi:hypothetical protein
VFGATGNADTLRDLDVVPLPPGVAATYVAAGDGHACALGNDGRLYCWGDCTRGQCGIPRPIVSMASYYVCVPGGPAMYFDPVASNRTVTAVAAGQAFTCAIAGDATSAAGRRELHCFGSNLASTLGLLNAGVNVLPGPTSSLVLLPCQDFASPARGLVGAPGCTPVAVSIGPASSTVHTVVLMDGGGTRVYVHGRNAVGEAGLPERLPGATLVGPATSPLLFSRALMGGGAAGPQPDTPGTTWPVVLAVRPRLAINPPGQLALSIVGWLPAGGVAPGATLMGYLGTYACSLSVVSATEWECYIGAQSFANTLVPGDGALPVSMSWTGKPSGLLYARYACIAPIVRTVRVLTPVANAAGKLQLLAEGACLVPPLSHSSALRPQPRSPAQAAALSIASLQIGGHACDDPVVGGNGTTGITCWMDAANVPSGGGTRRVNGHRGHCVCRAGRACRTCIPQRDGHTCHPVRRTARARGASGAGVSAAGDARPCLSF